MKFNKFWPIWWGKMYIWTHFTKIPNLLKRKKNQHFDEVLNLEGSFGERLLKIGCELSKMGDHSVTSSWNKGPCIPDTGFKQPTPHVIFWLITNYVLCEFIKNQ